MRPLIAFAVIALLSSAALLSRGQAQVMAAPMMASTQPGKQDFTLTPMRITRLQTVDYLYVSGQIADTDVAAKSALLNQVTKAITQAQITPTSYGPLFIDHGATSDPTHVFTMDVGFCVPPNTAAPAGCTIGNLPGNTYAVALYTGPTGFSKSMYLAIYSLYQQVQTSGHIPTDILRVRRLYRETPDSPNNVTQLEIELKN